MAVVSYGDRLKCSGRLSAPTKMNEKCINSRSKSSNKAVQAVQAKPRMVACGATSKVLWHLVRCRVPVMTVQSLPLFCTLLQSCPCSLAMRPVAKTLAETGLVIISLYQYECLSVCMSVRFVLLLRSIEFHLVRLFRRCASFGNLSASALFLSLQLVAPSFKALLGILATAKCCTSRLRPLGQSDASKPQ